MKSTITSKGQTTVPKRIRDQLHLSEGSKIEWTIDENKNITVQIAPEALNPFLAFLGAAPLPNEMTTDTFMREIRGERDDLAQRGPGANVTSIDEYLARHP
jgi:antitoxin PrlF